MGVAVAYLISPIYGHTIAAAYCQVILIMMLCLHKCAPPFSVAVAAAPLLPDCCPPLQVGVAGATACLLYNKHMAVAPLMPA